MPCLGNILVLGKLQSLLKSYSLRQALRFLGEGNQPNWRIFRKMSTNTKAADPIQRLAGEHIGKKVQVMHMVDGRQHVGRQGILKEFHEPGSGGFWTLILTSPEECDGTFESDHVSNVSECEWRSMEVPEIEAHVDEEGEILFVE